MRGAGARRHGRGEERRETSRARRGRTGRPIHRAGSIAGHCKPAPTVRPPPTADRPAPSGKRSQSRPAPGPSAAKRSQSRPPGDRPCETKPISALGSLPRRNEANLDPSARRRRNEANFAAREPGRAKRSQSVKLAGATTRATPREKRSQRRPSILRGATRPWIYSDRAPAFEPGFSARSRIFSRDAPATSSPRSCTLPPARPGVPSAKFFLDRCATRLQFCIPIGSLRPAAGRTRRGMGWAMTAPRSRPVGPPP